MSEQQRVFKITKTTPNDVLFTISPFSNRQLVREVYLTRRNPSAFLPQDWVLGIFLDDGIYNMYKNGIFTFDDNKAVIAAAQEIGLYFDETDFKEIKKDNTEIILNSLKSGNRQKIDECLKNYGNEVKEVSIAYSKDLPAGVISLIENKFNIQLTLDEM